MRSAPLTVLALVVLGACSSSNSSKDQALESQAIDGFIVGGAVFCDSEGAGNTSVGGHLTCPARTVLVTVRRGMDVGFDASTTASDLAFNGELRAPADLGFVTPLSTATVMTARASVGATVDLENDVTDTLTAINAALLDTFSPLALSASQLESTVAGDNRSLSFYSSDVRLSASANQSDSLVITLPDAATFHAVGTDSLGALTSAEALIDGQDTFSNGDEYFSVNSYRH